MSGRLRRAFSIIICIQLAALGYAVHKVEQCRLQGAAAGPIQWGEQPLCSTDTDCAELELVARSLPRGDYL